MDTVQFEEMCIGVVGLLSFYNMAFLALVVFRWILGVCARGNCARRYCAEGRIMVEGIVLGDCARRDYAYGLCSKRLCSGIVKIERNCNYVHVRA